MPENERLLKRGMLLAAGAGIIFSTGGVCVKLIPWAPLAINGARSFLSFFVVFIYMILKRRKLQVDKYVLLASAALTACHVFFIAATKYTAAGNAIVLQYAAPVHVILMTWLFMKKRPNRLEVIISLCVFTGIICFFLDSLSSGNLKGDIMGLLSGIFFAAYFTLGGEKKVDTLSALLITNALCFLIGLPALLGTDIPGAETVTVISILVLGIFQVAVGNIMLSEGLRTTPAVAAILLTSLEPVLNPIWVALIYRETLSPLSIAGFVIVLCSIGAYNYIKSSRGSGAAGKA